MLSRQSRTDLIGLALGAAVALSAASALAQDRCEGTLCDLYYANKPPPAPAPAAQPEGATPLVVPKRTLFGDFFGGSSQAQGQQQPADGSAPAKKPLVAVQGGGLLGMMRGAPQERCEGTLCDLYYGGSKPERSEGGAEPASTDAETAADMAPQTQPPARVIEQPEERHCADSRDPWSCYRR